MRVRVLGLLGLGFLLIAAPRVVSPAGSPPTPASAPLPAADIYQAAKKGDLATVTKLVEAKPELRDARNDMGATALHFAANNGQLEVVRYLLEKGADANIVDKMGVTPLLVAITHRQAEIARALLEKGANVSIPGPQGLSLLHIAVMSGQPEVLAMILSRKPNVDVRDPAGNTPLVTAVLYDVLPAVQALAGAGGDVNATNNRGNGPLDVAVREGYTPVEEYLRSKGAKARPDAPGPLSGPYLGQTPPGSTPVVFAPDVVSTEGPELNAVFSADGKEFYFTREVGWRIEVMRQVDGVWTLPKATKPAGEYGAVDPFMTRDGLHLYFSTDRPLDGKGPGTRDRDIWVTTRTARGLSEPSSLGETVNSKQGDYYPTLTNRGDLYFCSRREGGQGGHDIYRARLVHGRFERPENLGAPINTEYWDFDPFIAPDESYLIFGSDRPGGLGRWDLYISFRTKDGSWSPPRNMGKPINGPGNDLTPMLSPDGRYLFFASDRAGSNDIYWVDARVIEPFRPQP